MSPWLLLSLGCASGGPAERPPTHGPQPAEPSTTDASVDPPVGIVVSSEGLTTATLTGGAPAFAADLDGDGVAEWLCQSDNPAHLMDMTILDAFSVGDHAVEDVATARVPWYFPTAFGSLGGMDGDDYAIGSGGLGLQTVDVYLDPEEGSEIDGQIYFGDGRGSLSIGDLDGDGGGDLLLADLEGVLPDSFVFTGPINGLRDQGDATATLVPSAGETLACSEARGDVTGDGIDDAVLTAATSGMYARIFPGPLAGTVSSADAIAIGSPDNPDPYFEGGICDFLVPDSRWDFDQDGYTDFFWRSTLLGGAVWLGPFDADRAITAWDADIAGGTGFSFPTPTGDLDGDGFPDLGWAGAGWLDPNHGNLPVPSEDNKVNLLFGPFEGVRDETVPADIRITYPTGIPGIFVAGDADQDGAADLLLGVNDDAEYFGISWLFLPGAALSGL